MKTTRMKKKKEEEDEKNKYNNKKNITLPNGLILLEHFINLQQETYLLQEMNNKWSIHIKRKTKHY